MSTFSTSNSHTQPLKDKTNQISHQTLSSNSKPIIQTLPKQDSQHTPWSGRILQVQNGTTLSNCLKNPKQDLTKGSNELVQEEIRQSLTHNYRKTPEATIEMINQENLQKEKKVFGFLLKELESQIRHGKSIMNLSLPVSIYEHQSYLERQAHGLMYAPQFLEKAGAILNSFEQFKLTIAHFVASLHLLVNPQKSFNPILGETFQGIIGGCPVYAEQITRNPGTLRLQMYGKGFLLDELTEFEAVISMNSVKSRRKGYTKVEYKNTGTKVYVQFPAGVTSGTVFGKRTFEFVDKFYVVDLEHKYYAEIDFEKKNEKGWFFRKSKVEADVMVGGIWQVKQGFIDLVQKNINDMASMKVKFNENEHAMAKIEAIEGCWLENLKIGGESYWKFGEIWPNKLEYFDNPLPSDSNNRLDILYLRAGDEGKSQDWKKEIEEREALDKKLRENK